MKSLLPFYRWIHWVISTSGHNKHREGIPGTMREPVICCQTIHPKWPSQELCAMLGEDCETLYSFFLRVSVVLTLAAPLRPYLQDSTRRGWNDERWKKPPIQSTHRTPAARRGASSTKLLARTCRVSTREVDRRSAHPAYLRYWGKLFGYEEAQSCVCWSHSRSSLRHCMALRPHLQVTAIAIWQLHGPLDHKAGC